MEKELVSIRGYYLFKPSDKAPKTPSSHSHQVKGVIKKLCQVYIYIYIYKKMSHFLIITFPTTYTFSTPQNIKNVRIQSFLFLNKEVYVSH